jgi:hypothetical protein
MELTDKQKKKRQHEKELKSLRNRMGKNLVWFDSLSKRKQYDVLFLWKQYKYFNNLEKPKVRYVKVFRHSGGIQMIKVIDYPPNLKYFIKDLRLKFRFKVDKSVLRNSAIDLLLS